MAVLGLGSASLTQYFGRIPIPPISCFNRLFSKVADSTEIQVDLMPCETHNIDPPSNTATTTKGELMDFYVKMQNIRRMEVAADMAYKAKHIRGFCHLYDGQEAVMIGLVAGSNLHDSLITSYRDHAAHVCKGGTVKEVMGELFGKVIGASRGVGGSMHMYRKATNFYGGQGIVGAQTPVGAGFALAHKMKNDGLISFTLYGDGAANQGQLFEALNMSGLWKLPCIFVCENNHYGMGTSELRGSKSPNFFKRGDYIPGLKVNGMDVLAVKNAVAYARNYVLQNGPVIIEMDTYRYHGHSMSDPGSTYRTRDEVSSVRQERDPIQRVKNLLLQNELAEEKELKSIDKQIKADIDQTVKDALVADDPSVDFLYSNIYTDTKYSLLRGVTSEYYHQAKIIPYPTPA